MRTRVLLTITAVLSLIGAVPFAFLFGFNVYTRPDLLCIDSGNGSDSSNECARECVAHRMLRVLQNNGVHARSLLFRDVHIRHLLACMEAIHVGKSNVYYFKG